MKFPKLNLVEIAVGFFIQLPFYYLLGNWVFLLAGISGLCWAYGGAENGVKAVRRLGVPLLSCMAINAFNPHLWTVWLAFPFAWFTCSMGYGEESLMFNFFYHGIDHIGDDFKSKMKVADYYTRMMIYFFYWLFFGVALFLRFKYFFNK